MSIEAKTIKVEIPAPPPGWKYDGCRPVESGEMWLIGGEWKIRNTTSSVPFHVAVRAEWVPEEGQRVWQVGNGVDKHPYHSGLDRSNYWRTEAAAAKAHAAAQQLWSTLDHETGDPR